MIVGETRSTKFESRNKQEARNSNLEMGDKKVYDLEERILSFAKNIRTLVSSQPKSIAVIEDSKQLIRSSGSIGANYREANDSLSKKDFVMRAKIARKEAKETIYWLELLRGSSPVQIDPLIQEATELMKIMGAIIRSSE
jgi:four helix bundle protein